jgi:hypothetical protein
MSLRDVLAQAKNEEEIQKYITKNKMVLLKAFGVSDWYYNIVLPKFKFGDKFVSDYVVVCGQSYNYDIKLVELEPASTKMFLQKGDYSIMSVDFQTKNK